MEPTTDDCGLEQRVAARRLPGERHPTIVETPTFNRRRPELLDDEEYRLLQLALVRNPEFGRIIPGGGGVRTAGWETRRARETGRRTGDLAAKHPEAVLDVVSEEPRRKQVALAEMIRR